MGHYAKVVDGVVSQVIVADAEFFDDFIDTTAGEWVATSYNVKGGIYYDPATGDAASDQNAAIAQDAARSRKNFAGVGSHYDGTGFYAPQPYDSWTLNSTTYLWEAPTPYPTDGSMYEWDESITNWTEVS